MDHFLDRSKCFPLPRFCQLPHFGLELLHVGCDLGSVTQRRVSAPELADIILELWITTSIEGGTVVFAPFTPRDGIAEVNGRHRRAYVASALPAPASAGRCRSRRLPEFLVQSAVWRPGPGFRGAHFALLFPSLERGAAPPGRGGRRRAKGLTRRGGGRPPAVLRRRQK